MPDAEEGGLAGDPECGLGDIVDLALPAAAGGAGGDLLDLGGIGGVVLSSEVLLGGVLAGSLLVGRAVECPAADALGDVALPVAGDVRRADPGDLVWSVPDSIDTDLGCQVG